MEPRGSLATGSPYDPRHTHAPSFPRPAVPVCCRRHFDPSRRPVAAVPRAERVGIGDGAGYPSEFSPTKNVAWKTAVPFGQSSPVIAGGRALCDRASRATSSSRSRSMPGRARNSGAATFRRERRWRCTRRTTRPRPRRRRTSAASLRSSPISAWWRTARTARCVVAPDGPVSELLRHVGVADHRRRPRDSADRPAQGLVPGRARSRDGPGAMEDRSAVATIGYATPMIFRPPRAALTIITIGIDAPRQLRPRTGAPRWWTPSPPAARWVSRSRRATRCWSPRPAATSRACRSGRRRSGSTTRTRTAASPRAELIPDKELGEHFGWIDTSDDKFVTEAEWNVARTLGLGAWGSVA